MKTIQKNCFFSPIPLNFYKKLRFVAGILIQKKLKKADLGNSWFFRSNKFDSLYIIINN
jgi:hypothetical protein